ncbi:hypothetical protein GCM10008174_28420 [Methylopila turkensis]|uniref:Uncharacterized protein n=1 Tax=Methylopila turkensis TaxID=1437816 RepID=A0A9W6N867_9HYPH|nr:hypothetical protein GCM10008174_28420 [Methylopila turkensis]
MRPSGPPSVAGDGSGRALKARNRRSAGWDVGTSDARGRVVETVAVAVTGAPADDASRRVRRIEVRDEAYAAFGAVRILRRTSQIGLRAPWRAPGCEKIVWTPKGFRTLTVATTTKPTVPRLGRGERP